MKILRYIWKLIIFFLSWLLLLLIFGVFLICLKTTVAGFEPTPPEEKWFQVTRLRPLGHTVFVFILSFLFMYFNNIIYRYNSSSHPFLSVSSMHSQPIQYTVSIFWLFSLLNWSICCLYLFVLHYSYYFLFIFLLFIYLFIFSFSFFLSFFLYLFKYFSVLLSFIHFHFVLKCFKVINKA